MNTITQKDEAENSATNIKELKVPKKTKNSETTQKYLSNTSFNNNRSLIQTAEDIKRLLLHTTHDCEARVAHDVIPAFNIGQIPLGCDDFSFYPKCKFMSPRPIYITEKHCNAIDICHKRLIAHYNYKNRILHAKTRYTTAKANNRETRKLEKKGLYNRNIFSLAERLEKIPDVNFLGNYDYYYTGGNLSVFPDNKPFIIHVDGEDLNQLNFSTFPSDTSLKTVIIQNESTRAAEGKGEVLEIFSMRSSTGKPHFAVRKEKNVTFYYANNDNYKITAISQLQIKSLPFTSFGQSSIEPETFLISSLNQYIRHYDLGHSPTKLVKLYKCQSSSESKYWNFLKAWPNTKEFIFANEKQVCFIDLRIPEDEWLRSECYLPGENFNCDFISSLTTSKFTNLFYLGTTHKLHCVDARYMGPKLFQKGTVCSWTHQLEYAPAFIDTLRYAESEVVAISSALAGDLHICELTAAGQFEGNDIETSRPMKISSKHLYKSCCLPYQPPTLQEAYESARLSGKCLQPHSHLKDRIKCSTTGMKFYKNSVKELPALLLISSSNGDVYAHNIKTRKSDKLENLQDNINSFSRQCICHFEESVCQIPQPGFDYTNVIHMNGMKKVFRCGNLSTLKTEGNSYQVNGNGEPVLHRNRLGRWQKSLKSLSNYKDILAMDLLSVWYNEVDEEEDYIKIRQLNKKRKVDPKSNVENWLTESEVKLNTMISIPMSSLNNYEIDEFNLTANTNFDIPNISTNTKKNTFEEFSNEIGFHSTQDMNNSFEPGNTSDFNLINTSMQNKEIKKKQKSKYVKGF